MLQTNRLILREFKPGDLEYLGSILVNPQVMKFSSSGPCSIEEAQIRLEKFIESYQIFGFGKWAVCLRGSNQLIGYCGIAMEKIDGKDEKELGYRLDSQYWGQGLATEAASATVKYGFEALNLPYILGVVERSNQASVRVLEKVGMKYERVTIFQGSEMDVYRITSSEL